jgi:hypothetical protein
MIRVFSFVHMFIRCIIMNNNTTIKSNKMASIGMGLLLIFGYGISFFMMAQLVIILTHVS